MDPYQSLLGSAFDLQHDVSAELHRQQNTRGMSSGTPRHDYRVYPGETWHSDGQACGRKTGFEQPDLPRGYPDYEQTVPHVGPMYAPMLPPQEQHTGQSAAQFAGYDQEHVVGEYRDMPRLLAERVVEEQPIMRPIMTVERTVEVPTVIVKERVKNVPRTQLVERVIEVPVVSYEEHVKEVPVKRKVVTKVEVPYERLEEKIIYVPKIEYQERVIEVPKVEYVEKIVYEDRIEYREVPYDTYVEVPEIEYKYVQVPYDVPEAYFQEVPEYRFKETPAVEIQEVSREEFVPAPHPAQQMQHPMQQMQHAAAADAWQSPAQNAPHSRNEAALGSPARSSPPSLWNSAVEAR